MWWLGVVIWRGGRCGVAWGVVVGCSAGCGSAERGSGWVRNMYDDLLRLTPTFVMNLIGSLYPFYAEYVRVAPTFVYVRVAPLFYDGSGRIPPALCDVFARVAPTYVMNMFGSLAL